MAFISDQIQSEGRLTSTGLAGSALVLFESAFAAAAGSAYSPPERGTHKRLPGARQIQLLQDSPVAISAYPSTQAEIWLPQVITDASPGRMLFIRNSGTAAIVVKDAAGTPLLTVAAGLQMIFIAESANVWQFFFQANAIPFSDGDFLSNNVNDAIVEAKQNAEGFPRAGARFSYNGVMGNNDWLGPNELLSDNPLLVFPVKTKLNEISWANRNSDKDFRIQFRQNSRTGPIVYTLTVASPNPGYGIATSIDVTFNAGDTLEAQYIDDGLNASDLDLILWISRVPEV